MTDDRLTPALGAAHNAWKARGARTRQRFADWVKEARVLSDDGERGGGNGGTSSQQSIRDRLEDQQASRYLAELDTLTRRMEADAHRLVELCDLANPANPKAAPDQGCRSCARNGGHYEPVHEGRYKSACRFCGEWRAGHGDWPPLAVIRWRHQNPGKRLPLRIVEQAS